MEGTGKRGGELEEMEWMIGRKDRDESREWGKILIERVIVGLARNLALGKSLGIHRDDPAKNTFIQEKKQSKEWQMIFFTNYTCFKGLISKVYILKKNSKNDIKRKPSNSIKTWGTYRNREFSIKDC